MWILIKLIGGWLISWAWKTFWKKPINWGSKIKTLLPIISKVITWRQRKAGTDTPSPEGTDKRLGWRLRRLFKRG